MFYILLLQLVRLEITNPTSPFNPYILKNSNISFPEAKPAPMIVPIITKTTFNMSISTPPFF